MPGKKRGNFSPEFKEEAARMVVETSRSIAEVARELGVNGTTLGYWVKAYRESHAGDEPGLGISERARLRELERRNRELEMENAFLKKQRHTSRGSPGEREICVHRGGGCHRGRKSGPRSDDHPNVRLAAGIPLRVL